MTSYRIFHKSLDQIIGFVSDVDGLSCSYICQALLLLISAQSLNLETKGAELTLKSQRSEENKNENDKLPI